MGRKSVQTALPGVELDRPKKKQATAESPAVRTRRPPTEADAGRVLSGDPVKYIQLLRNLSPELLQRVLAQLSDVQRRRVEAALATDSDLPIFQNRNERFRLPSPETASTQTATPAANTDVDFVVTQRGTGNVIPHLVSGTQKLDADAPYQDQIPKKLEVKRAKSRTADDMQVERQIDEVVGKLDGGLTRETAEGRVKGKLLDPRLARSEYYMDGTDRALFRQLSEMPLTKKNLEAFKEIIERVQLEQARDPQADIAGPYARVLERIRSNDPVRFGTLVTSAGFDAANPDSIAKFRAEFGPDRQRRPNPNDSRGRPDLEKDPPLEKQRSEYDMPPRVVFGPEVGKKFEPNTQPSGQDDLPDQMQEGQFLAILNDLLRDTNVEIAPTLPTLGGRARSNAATPLIRALVREIERVQKAEGKQAFRPRQQTGMRYINELNPLTGQMEPTRKLNDFDDDPAVVGPGDAFNYPPGVGNMIRTLAVEGFPAAPGRGPIAGLRDLELVGRRQQGKQFVPYTPSSIVLPSSPQAQRAYERRLQNTSQKRDNLTREILMEFLDGKKGAALRGTGFIPKDIQDYRQRFPFLIDRDLSDLIQEVSRRHGILPLDQVLQGLRVNVPYRSGDNIVIGRLPSNEAGQVLTASSMVPENLSSPLAQLIEASRQIYERLPPHPTRQGSIIAKNLEGKTVISGDNMARINKGFEQQGKKYLDVIEQPVGPRFLQLTPDQQAEMVEVLNKQKPGSGDAYRASMEARALEEAQVTPPSKRYLDRLEKVGVRRPSAALPSSLLNGLMV